MMDDWTEKVKAAHEMVSALCSHPDSNESRKWIMSIPARPDYDPDLVITSGLMAAEKQIAAVTAERDELKRRLDAVVEMLQPAPDEKLQKMYAEDLHVEYAIRELYPLAAAIAEGRDNG